MNTREALSWAKSELKSKGVMEPESSALVLLGEVLRMGRADLLAHPEKKLSLLERKKFNKYIARRKKHESVWHIIGKVQFCGLDFTINNDVLVPRPETELLVEQVTQCIKKLEIEKLNENCKLHLSPVKRRGKIVNSRIEVLDLGTGSGAIAIALAKELSLRGAKGDEAISRDRHASLAMTNFKIVATDISQKALRVARKNAKLNGVSGRIEFIEADLFRPVTKNELLNTKFDLITANLPYIPSEDMDTLAVDVYHYEPKLALDGGPGGLKIYEKMLKNISSHLKPDGKVFCEIGVDQGKEFETLVKKYLPNHSVRIQGDLAGIDRVAIIESTKK